MKTLQTEKQKKVYGMLNYHTKKQRNDYYQGVIKYETNQIKKYADMEVNDQSHWKAKHLQETAQNDLADRLGLFTYKWLQEAEQFFDAKLMVMVGKLEGFGFLRDDVTLDFSTMQVSARGDFEFWIQAYEKSTYESLGRVYARLIPVDGYEKCFHYRFITTLKK